MCPQLPHRLELDNHLSSSINVRPYQSRLYSSCPIDSPQLASPIESASFWLFIIFFTAKSKGGDGLVFTHQSSRQLVKKILSGITDFQMHFCYFKTRFVSIIRCFLFATQRLLSFFQLATFRIEAFWVANLFACTQSNQASYTQINPNFIGSFRQCFNIDIYQQPHRPSSSGRKLHPDSVRDCTFGKFSTPSDCKRFDTLSKVNLPIFPSESRFSELCTTAVPFLFERGWDILPGLQRSY